MLLRWYRRACLRIRATSARVDCEHGIALGVWQGKALPPLPGGDALLQAVKCFGEECHQLVVRLLNAYAGVMLKPSTTVLAPCG